VAVEGVFHLSDPQLQVFADVAVAIALDAGAILRSRFGEPHDISFKGPLDLVTEADKAAESLIATRLRSAFPDHDLMGEEGSRSENTGARLRWVIDPLDGTTNFAHGLPTFAVSIALEDAGQPVAGVIYDPMRNELYRAIKGGGASLNGEPIRVSRTEHVHSAILVTGFAHTLEQRRLQGAAPDRIGCPEPLLCGGRAARRLLGARHPALGCLGRRVAGCRSWRTGFQSGRWPVQRPRASGGRHERIVAPGTCCHPE
jgi:hypothetical protein